jgi:GT2 family glycosyltransferase
VRASFLIPVRDAALTVAAAVGSALAQTVADIEVVVVDDGSRDETAAVVSSIPDPRIRLLRTPPQGIVPALQAGLAVCRAPFVARLDGDDLAPPDRLAHQLPLLEDDARTAVVDGQVRFFRAGGEVPGGMLRYQEWINGVLQPTDFDREILVESPVVHPAATLRLAAVAEVGGYRDGPFPEDYDLWLRLHRAGYRFRKVDRVLVHMHDREARLTRTDPRYSKAAFRSVRQEWLSVGPLARPRRLVLWGAGRGGRPWLRWLRESGHEVVAVVDIDPKKIGRTRQDVPVVAPDALSALDAELCLVAVGAAGARPLIRAALGQLRPDWIEGRHWWAVQ